MTSRNCSYCGKELTDAVSLDAGIGPVCRKMDNHVVAQLKVADLKTANELIEWIVPKYLPEETHNTFDNVKQDLTNTANNDWRKTCKRISWILSYNVHCKISDSLIATVEALGYISLASILRGEVAKSPAVVTFEAGRIYLQAKRNKYGNASIKDIRGRRFHPDTKQWSVPADKYKEFQLTVWKHYPRNTGLTESIEAAKNNKSAEVSVIAPKTAVTVTALEGILKISSPYNAQFVAALKSAIASWGDRKWNKSERVWEVSVVHVNVLKNLVAEHYGEKISL